MSEILYTDVIIVGGGLAGLTAAKHITDKNVVVLSNVNPGKGGSSSWAQGGVAVALGEDDDASLHLEDTLKVAVGLANPQRVEVLVREGIPRMQELLAMGVPFDRDDEGVLHLGREAAHSRRRIVHAGGDRTGWVIMQELVNDLKSTGGNHVQWVSGQALDIIVIDGKASGVVYRTENGSIQAIVASAVILATGGMGQLYQWTTNPQESAGDGLAMAVRAGATVVDLEFVQFHPTALRVESDSEQDEPVPLLSEAIRGEGATLVDDNGVRFMLSIHPDAELAPRDVVARSIAHQLENDRQVYLDISSLEDRFFTRFPTAVDACRRHGINLDNRLIPVTPAAHYHMGGIAVDDYSRTTVAGLWACGEVASTGIHGANRLASNSLLEALVFGARAGQSINAELLAADNNAQSDLLDREVKRLVARWSRNALTPQQEIEVKKQVRSLMWQYVGVVRTEYSMTKALARIDALQHSIKGNATMVENRLLVAKLLTQSALRRAESRGAHYREDFRETDPAKNYRLFVDGQTLSMAEVYA